MRPSSLCVNKLNARFLSSVASKKRNVVLVDGVRIPFTLAGSVYGNYLAVDLGRFAL